MASVTVRDRVAGYLRDDGEAAAAIRGTLWRLACARNHCRIERADEYSLRIAGGSLPIRLLLHIFRFLHDRRAARLSCTFVAKHLALVPHEHFVVKPGKCMVFQSPFPAVRLELRIASGTAASAALFNDILVEFNTMFGKDALRVHLVKHNEPEIILEGSTRLLRWWNRQQREQSFVTLRQLRGSSGAVVSVHVWGHERTLVKASCDRMLEPDR